MGWRERYVVERAQLDPQYDKEFFSNVDFPDGTPMYEVRNGNIVRSWQQGAPETLGRPVASAGPWRWVLVWLNVAVLVVLAIVLIVRKRIAARRRQPSD